MQYHRHATDQIKRQRFVERKGHVVVYRRGILTSQFHVDCGSP
jgi:hypothetical protein